MRSLGGGKWRKSKHGKKRQNFTNGFVSRVGDVDVPSEQTFAMPIWLSSGKRNGNMLEI